METDLSFTSTEDLTAELIRRHDYGVICLVQNMTPGQAGLEKRYFKQFGGLAAIATAEWASMVTKHQLMTQAYRDAVERSQQNPMPDDEDDEDDDNDNEE